jgi:cell division protein FtsZ
MIVIPNERLLAVAKDAGFFESFRIADDVLRQGVQGISDIITIPGIINRDFADVKTTMSGMGYAVMGTAMRGGPNRANEAAHAAMSSPLLEEGAIDGARGILINISGSSSLKLSEVNEASTIIQSSAHEDANIIFGAVLDESLGDDIKITVIATGFRPDLPSRADHLSVPHNVGGRTGAQLPNGVPASAFSNRPVASPKFASEIAEEQAQQSAASTRPTTAAASTPAKAPKPAEAPVQSAQPRENASSAAQTSSQHIHAAERAATPVPAARLAEMEDQQLDVPAYLRRNDL